MLILLGERCKGKVNARSIFLPSWNYDALAKLRLDERSEYNLSIYRQIDLSMSHKQN